MGDLIEKKEVNVLQFDEKALAETRQVLNKSMNYLSRLQTAASAPMKTIDEEKMNYITEKVAEINEKIYVFSKSSSQTGRKLMSLTMLFPADATYRVMQQISAQIERKQQAIQENLFRLKEQQIKLAKYKKKLEQATDEIDKQLYQTKIEKAQHGIANAFSYIEAALKEIGYLLESYEQIKKNKNIPDDWDEYDFEKAEIDTNIKNAFRNALRDFLVHGRIGMGTCEYFEQFGISPIEAVYEVQQYITRSNKMLNEGKSPDYDDLYNWLNEMAKKYHDCYKKACKRIGISDDLISRKFTLIASEEKLKQLEGNVDEDEETGV